MSMRASVNVAVIQKKVSFIWGQFGAPALGLGKNGVMSKNVAYSFGALSIWEILNFAIISWGENGLRWQENIYW